ncbi:MAG TPA: zf-TFIIB domain-containing protein [Candidatus Thermoplasmatota archaeon]|nr:zf-TFIIB domain-containing protein [Candidatus Thermoplasmatota archaeon]
MKCPSCNETLVMSERQGIEIDYCPQCRGVWLDRGELDKIIDRSIEGSRTAPAAPQAPAHQGRPPQAYRDDVQYDKYGNPKRKKREGFLADLFD